MREEIEAAVTFLTRLLATKSNPDPGGSGGGSSNSRSSSRNQSPTPLINSYSNKMLNYSAQQSITKGKFAVTMTPVLAAFDNFAALSNILSVVDILLNKF